MAFLKLMEGFSPEKIFQSSQAVLLLVIGVAFALFSWNQAARNRRYGKDGFKFDEEPTQKKQSEHSVKQTLLLEGIRLQGAPHEVLGIAPNASAPEIHKAYKDLMKRFHPDRVGPQGSREWKDAQAIAEALNSARQQMLQNLRK